MYSNFRNSAVKQHGQWNGDGMGSGHSHAPLLIVWGKRGKDTILEVPKEILIAF
jgi:hypothetical protein